MENKLYIANIETQHIRPITLGMLITFLNTADGMLEDSEYIYMNYQDAVDCIKRELNERG